MAGSLHHVEIVFLLSYVSLALNVLILIFSMVKLEYAYTTFFTATALSLATIPYHVFVVHAHRQDMKRDAPDERGGRNVQILYPSSTTTSLVCLYVLLGSWILPLALIGWQMHRSSSWNAVVQLVLIVMELVVLVAVASVCTCQTHYPGKWVTRRDDL